MSLPKFSVCRFENRNGAISWKVDGYLHGVRIRKNFKTREEAAAEKATLELKAVQALGGARVTTTVLDDAQLREAEAVFQRVKGQPKSLSFYVDFAVANYREPAPSKPLTEAVATYVAIKQRERDRDLLSGCQLKTIVNELAALEERFPKSSLSQLTASALVAHCERNAGSLKTYNNRRAILSTFLKFAHQSEWMAENPIAKVPYYRIAHRRGMAVTINAERAAELMEYVEQVEEGALVPFFALCLFAGIRPSQRDGEISKLRPEHIRLDTGVILIEPTVSKVRMPRRVAIQPNLAAWLRAYPFEAIDPGFVDHHRLKVTKKFDLAHDVLRHTFISMFVGKFRSIGEAALQAGNSEAIIRKHYLDLKTVEEADDFFSIMPKHRVVPEIIPTARTAEPTLRVAV